MYNTCTLIPKHIRDILNASTWIALKYMHPDRAHGHMVCMWFVPRKYVFETNRFIFIFSLLVLAWEPLVSQQQLQCPLLWAVRHLGHWVTPSGFKWEILMVCSYAYHKAGSNNNNKVCLFFPASHFSCRKSLQHIIKIIQSLALLLEGRQHSARAAGSSVRRCQTTKHHASQVAECAPSLGLEGSRRKESSPVLCSWCLDGPCLPKLLHRRKLHFLWYTVLYKTLNDNLEISIQHNLAMLYCEFSKHLFPAELAGSFLSFSFQESHFS